MRTRSSIVRWGFEADFRSFGGGFAGGVSGQVVDAVSTDFGVISGVSNGRRERFGEVQDICFGVAAGVAGGVSGFLACSEGVTGLDIVIFGVVVGEVVS